jgi:hypothetical protein
VRPQPLWRSGSQYTCQRQRDNPIFIFYFLFIFYFFIFFDNEARPLPLFGRGAAAGSTLFALKFRGTLVHISRHEPESERASEREARE